ncbi:glutamate--tRNA ligase [Candidatus Mycoplasma haematominutum]|uniref:Glutamate--tRNA ligase n=1 Tax=Candidatus Mycoplasma haematominutum 'Birmingham 1' TaxID=1116213 RepID=G8C2T8_9MOLU|nr:glutamate--tRNA ligase [Candidatus Mycoplasma haematominutum]CCE66636.1 glutamyl-tRNA synthetase [Candidatus Mycoplasma haematominutum 'Birmingham 1']
MENTVTPSRKVRTRFAPSPTGALHIGGLRTALINYLYAKQYNGEFILRIEDTDSARNQNSQIKEILDDLESLSLIPDESFICPGEYGPYLQSQRMDRYRERMVELLKKKKVYRCFCSPKDSDSSQREEYLYSGKCRKLSEAEVKEKLTAKAPFCIRLEVDNSKTYEWNDYVRGRMSVPASSMGDIILMRSSGAPTYNFAVTVDDYEMKITDVFRGEEHLSNTPYQLALYEAFGWQESIPNYGHLSVILGASGKKISKRDADSEKYFVTYFLDKGFYPEALLNYLLILGWTEGEREFFTLRESIESFSTAQLSGAPSSFDYRKLEWMSQSYLNQLELLQYLNFSLPFFRGEYEEFTLKPSKRREFAICFRSRVKYASFLDDLATQFYAEEYLTAEVIKELKSFSNITTILRETLKELQGDALNRFEEFELRLTLKKLLSKLAVPPPTFYQSLRLSLIGEKEGLPLHSVIYLLGLQRATCRLERVLDLFPPKDSS